MVYLAFPKAEIRDVCCLKKDILIFPAGNIYLTVGSKSVIVDRSHDKGGKSRITLSQEIDEKKSLPEYSKEMCILLFT